MATSGGRRRPRKRQRKNKEHLIWITSGAALILIGLFFLLLDDDSDSNRGAKTRRASSNLRLERCRSSCEDVILSSGDDLSYSLLTSSALASSAVDALFLLRDSDVDELREEYGTSRKRSKSSNTSEKRGDRSESGGEDGGRFDVVDDFWENVAPPPMRLPPLIETLVGAVDGRYSTAPGKKEQSKIIIAQGDAARSAGVSVSSVPKPRVDSGSADESVAMAAAAAAAAFWSQSTLTGKHRMRTVNEEWERALRWIAGWGQSSDGNKSISDADPASGGRKRGRKSRQEKSGDRHEKSSMVDRGLRSSFLEACIEECTGNHQKALVNGKQKILGFWPEHEGRFLLGFLSLLLTGKTKVTWGSIFSSEQKSFIIGSIRIALSSAALFAFSSVWKWLGPYLSSSRLESTVWLSEEKDAANGRSGKSVHKSSSKKKALMSKRARRRKVPSQTRQCPPNDAREEQVVNDEQSGPNNSLDDDDVDFDSLRRLVSPDDKLRVATRKAAGMSLRCEISRCSLGDSPRASADDSAFVIRHCSESGRRVHDSDCTMEHRNEPEAPACVESNVGNDRLDPASACDETRDCTGRDEMGAKMTDGKAAIEKAPELFHRVETEKVTGDVLVPLAPLNFDLASNQYADLKQRSLLGFLQLDSPAVPTDEQRDLASRQLREYQRVQVLKIMQRRGLLGPLQLNPGMILTGSRPAAAPASATTAIPAFPVRRIGRESAVIGPPPGLVLSHEPTKNHSVCVESPSSDSVDIDLLASGKFLPSNILDTLEEDERPASSTIRIAAPAQKNAMAPKACSPVLNGFGPYRGYSAKHVSGFSIQDSCWGPLKLSFDTTQNVQTNVSGTENNLDSTTLSSWTSSDSDGGSSVGKLASW